MRREALPSSFPHHDEMTDGATEARYELDERDEQFVFSAMVARKRQSRQVDYAFGSGATGMTFVSAEGRDRIIEFHLSYFPERHQWRITPGHPALLVGLIGKAHDRVHAQRCFGCHATTLGESQVIPERKFFAVGCEACHGPGKGHIEAMKKNSSDLNMDRSRAWSAERVNEVCAQCHRAERDIDPLSVSELQQTQRFQPYGLMKSQCYVKSGKQLSCVTCHDPHQNAVREETHYVKVCQSCHASPKLAKKTCPVNSKNKCVGCHMPKREVAVGIAMADHWIRVFRGSSSSKRTP